MGSQLANGALAVPSGPAREIHQSMKVLQRIRLGFADRQCKTIRGNSSYRLDFTIW